MLTRDKNAFDSAMTTIVSAECMTANGKRWIAGLFAGCTNTS